MEIIKTIRPGQDGSKRYQEKYGDQLCAVRYRRSPCKSTVYTTVEIIVAQREAYQQKGREQRPEKVGEDWVAIKIAYEELELRNEIRRIGGRWSRMAKAWVAKRHLVSRLNIDHRIVEGLVDQCLDVGI
ncbi:hypothetical protein [Microbulbifer sp. ALW1]|uniref:hypothetical protein n=1 Tax=Microbulbifer sp. (strain ALW1) TaxID=1516059 RepID=UPI00135CB30D|nr:hypothetical protein [Microbulbifer sp. ALW1]